MSSTNRGATRNEHDAYYTPAWCVDAIVPYVGLPFVSTVLDPCAGDGRVLEAVRIHCPRVMVYGMDIAPTTHPAIECCDALTRAWGEPDLVITNPPFKFAMEFVQRALDCVEQTSGVVAFLMRLSMLAGQKRSTFWSEHPCDVYVLSRRPSFDGKGTDSCDYAWFVWGPDRGGRWVVLP